MKSYLFTLLVRFFVPVSAFGVFVVSSILFGAEGRGVIGYGSAIASLCGLLFSFNLGRSFLYETKKNQNLKKNKLPEFLTINYFLMFIASLTALIFFSLNSSAIDIVNFELFLPFLLLTPYYLWTVNGDVFYAAINKTTIQDNIILSYRLVLLITMFFIYVLNINNISTFIYLYAFILFFGVLIEINFLGKSYDGFKHLGNLKKYISDSKNVHLDYLAFNIFPLVLMIISGFFLKLSDLGKLNFLIQLINFIFIFSNVASIRVKNYVADIGSASRLNSIKKLIFFTLFISLFSIILIFILLNSVYFNETFRSFSNLSIYFFIISISLPGFALYQFSYPILLEYNFINYSMKFNSAITIIIILSTIPLLKYNGFLGAVISFVLFYSCIFLSQLYLLNLLRVKFLLNKNIS